MTCIWSLGISGMRKHKEYMSPIKHILKIYKECQGSKYFRHSSLYIPIIHLTLSEGCLRSSSYHTNWVFLLSIDVSGMLTLCDSCLPAYKCVLQLLCKTNKLSSIIIQWALVCYVQQLPCSWMMKLSNRGSFNLLS